MIKIKKVTIYTLAEELGMTPSMVSRALNPNGKVNEQKRQLVLKTAEKYNFVPNKMASRLSGAEIKIGVVLNTDFNPILEDMQKGLNEAYQELKDYKIKYDSVALGKGSDDEIKKYLKKFCGYDGIIVSGLSAKVYNSLSFRPKNLVQLQNTNEQIDYLFSSVYDMELASDTAAEFLSDCLKFKKSKNILLLTGTQTVEGSVHRGAQKTFTRAAERNGLKVTVCREMNDSEEQLAAMLPEIFAGNDIDGIYITSGVSLSLCEFLKKNNLGIPTVTFDVYDSLNEYIKDGTITATIFQDAKTQAKTAFEKLVFRILNNEIPPKTVKTSVHLVMKSNLKLYE